MSASGEVLVAASIVCSPQAPAQARAALRDGLEGVIARQAVDAVLLVASELVSNCVRHAGLHDDELIDINVKRDNADLRLEVADGGPGFDSPPTRDEDDAAGEPGTSGRGLHIVNNLALEWGVGRAHGKNTVWVRLDGTGKGAAEPDPR